MDPVTQGTVGAIVPQSFYSRKTKAMAIIVGALSGMAPDLDILIRSSQDPLLQIQYHRHFTHSLFFIPFGALLCTWVIRNIIRRLREAPFFSVYLLALVSISTHGPLDALTSYGTSLFWPLNSVRVAVSSIAVVDLFWTLPVLVGVLLFSFKKQKGYLLASLIWCHSYFLLGLYKQNEAEKVLDQYLAAATVIFTRGSDANIASHPAVAIRCAKLARQSEPHSPALLNQFEQLGYSQLARHLAAAALLQLSQWLIR